MQREMPWFQPLANAEFAPDSAVTGWKTYRDAVMWCWQNRPHRGMNEPDDQAMFARHVGMHAPHMSRCVNPRTKAPMKLDPDLVPAFEAYTGWRGITQYMTKIGKTTLMEEVIARRAA